MESSERVEHLKFLNRSIELAWQAREVGNHPFGALLVRQGEIVVENANAVVSNANKLHHAELRVLDKAIGQLSSEALSECTLYTSTEPCVMCCGGIYWSGVRRLVYAFSAEELGQITGRQFVIPCRDLMVHTHEKVQITGPFNIAEARKVHEGYWGKHLAGHENRGAQS